MRDHVKDLSRLGRDLRRTVIIDNNPFSFLLQPENGVPCVPFFGHQADDTQVRGAGRQRYGNPGVHPATTLE